MLGSILLDIMQKTLLQKGSLIDLSNTCQPAQEAFPGCTNEHWLDCKAALKSSPEGCQVSEELCVALMTLCKTNACKQDCSRKVLLILRLMSLRFIKAHQERRRWGETRQV